MISKLKFNLEFPQKILTRKKVKFMRKKERANLLKRNIYYYRHDGKKNEKLEKRSATYYLLAKKILQTTKKEFPNKKVLNISLFGSSLISGSFSDYDFLVIISGNEFTLKEQKVRLGDKEIDVGISIKGIKNLSQGKLKKHCNTSYSKQKEVINRTTSTLYRRHLPIMGYDFKKNQKTFQNNVHPIISDLLGNTYYLYYLNNKSKKLSKYKRSKKILSRVYETLSYLEFVEAPKKISKLKKIAYLYREKEVELTNAKDIFKKTVLFYKDKLRKNKNEK